MNKAEALAAVDRLAELSRGFGAADDSALSEVRRIVRQLEHARLGGHLYLHEKLHKIEDWAGIGFSARKHVQYVGGAEQLTVWVLGACSTARGLIQQHWPAD